MRQFEQKATRVAYGEALVELGHQRKDLVVLDADVAKSISSNKFHKEFPERAFNVGVAEQNMMGIAAGLATTGKTVFVSTYAVFATMRACEQIRTFIANPGLNVKIGASHGGIHTGEDGVTHQAIEDLGIIRSIPGITIFSPSDAVFAAKCTHLAAEMEGPVYIRLTRNPVPVFHSINDDFIVGKAVELVDYGTDVTIVATGIMVFKALEAAGRLKKKGVCSKVLEVHTIRPLDRETLVAAARETGAVVIAEDHNINGGLGSAVAEVLGEEYPVPIERVGLRDTYGESGEGETLLTAYRMNTEHIEEACLKVIRKKDKKSY